MRIAVYQTGSWRFSKQFIKKLFAVIVSLMPRYVNSEVSVAFVGNRVIRRLNRQYRGKDKVTDILSFAERDGMSVPASRELLGEILIDYPRVRRQALKRQRRVRDELIFLLIHGFLHLVGYDHGNGREEQKMRQWERRIARAFEGKRRF